jgi:hypothetical protein
MSDTTVKKVSSATSPKGEMGQICLTSGKQVVYRPRLVGHRLGAYAARATAESCSSLIAAGGRKPCRSISQAAL